MQDDFVVKSSGIAHFFTKPIEIKALKEKINEISSDTLVKVGLNGHQLVLKHQTYKTARAKFRSLMEIFNQLRANNMKEIIYSVLSLSKTINIILNGLSAGIPQVYAVKGFKEAIVDIIS